MLSFILPFLLLSTPAYADDLIISFKEFPALVDKDGLTYAGLLYDEEDSAAIIQREIDFDVLLAEHTRDTIKLETLQDVYTAKENVLQDTIQNRNELILRLQEDAKRTWWEKHDGEVMLVAGAGIVTAIVVALNPNN